jgi:hypothetical protein
MINIDVDALGEAESRYPQRPDFRSIPDALLWVEQHFWIFFVIPTSRMSTKLLLRGRLGAGTLVSLQLPPPPNTAHARRGFDSALSRSATHFNQLTILSRSDGGVARPRQRHWTSLFCWALPSDMPPFWSIRRSAPKLVNNNGRRLCRRGYRRANCLVGALLAQR